MVNGEWWSSVYEPRGCRAMLRPSTTIHYLLASVSGGCHRKIFEGGERLVVAVGEDDEAGEPEQLEELERVQAHVREGDARAAPLGLVDDAEQDRDADAVDQLRVAEVDDERTAAPLHPRQALALDALAAHLVDVVAGVDDRDLPRPRL